MSISSKPLWGTLAVLILAALVLSACGDVVSSDESTLPDLDPTVTAVPPTTPTPVPQEIAIELPDVDWNDLEPFRAAMRPEFQDDVAQFVDANRYYIEGRLTFESGVAVVYGSERVRYTNHSADTLDSVVFRLYPNMTASGGQMAIYETRVNGEPVEPMFTERDTVLIVPLESPLEPGEAVEIDLQFSTAAERGMYAGYGVYGYHYDTFAGAEWFPVLSVYEEDRGWWTLRPVTWGDSVYSETGLFETRLTVPENFVLAFSGSELDTTDNGDGTKTVHYASGPMRNSMLIAGAAYGILSDEVDGTTVNVYFWPGGESAAEDALDIALDSVRVNNEAYGAYPFEELDVVETFVFTAMEHPGMITVADRWWERGNRSMEFGIVHEIGHQWFFSLVGNNQVEHPWIDESLTVYTEFYYTREIYGEEEARDWLQRYHDWYNYYRGTGAPDLVLNLPVSAYSDNNYGAIIYGKGPLFYTELEKTIGRENFEKAVRLYFERYRYDVAESKDILYVFEEVTEQDLDAFFYQWVGEFEGLDPDVIENVQARAD